MVRIIRVDDNKRRYIKSFWVHTEIMMYYDNGRITFEVGKMFTTDREKKQEKKEPKKVNLNDVVEGDLQL